MDRPKLSRNNLKLNFKDDEPSLTLRLAYATIVTIKVAIN